MKGYVMLLVAFCALPTSGEAWQQSIRLAPIRQAVVARLQQSNVDIVDPDRRGGEGMMRAQGLSDWLVVLGVPSQNIETTPGYSRDDPVAIVLRPREELQS
jgi:hypothetical protein